MLFRSPGGGAQLIIQSLAGEGDVVVVAALDAGIVGLTDRAGSQHGVEQLGVGSVAAGGADADDVVHIVELEQLVGIDADGGHFRKQSGCHLPALLS